MLAKVSRSPGPDLFYDVTKRRVQVLAIVPKAGADEWLSKAGEKP